MGREEGDLGMTDAPRVPTNEEKADAVTKALVNIIKRQMDALVAAGGSMESMFDLIPDGPGKVLAVRHVEQFHKLTDSFKDLTDPIFDMMGVPK